MIKENTHEFFRKIQVVNQSEHLNIKVKLIEDFKRVRFYLRFERFHAQSFAYFFNTEQKKQELLLNYSFILKQVKNSRLKLVLNKLIFEFLMKEEMEKLKIITNKYLFFYKGRLIREIRNDQLLLFKLHSSSFFYYVSDNNHYLLVSINQVLVRLQKEVLKTTHWLWNESLYGHRKSIFKIDDIKIFYNDFKHLNLINTAVYKNFTGYGVNV